MKLHNNWKKELTDRIIKLAGKNPAAFARKATISDQTFRTYLHGSIPGGDKVLEIANAGNVSTDWLLTGHEETSKSPPGWTFDSEVREEYNFLTKVVSEANEGIREGRTAVSLCQLIKGLMDNQLIKLQDIKKRRG